MNERELYRKKMQAKLNEAKAELDKLKAKAEGAGADRGLKLAEQIKNLENKIEGSKKSLGELAEKSDDAWQSAKEGLDSAWDSLKEGLRDAASKFKE